MKFTKGHGTGNDFVIVEDLDGTSALDSTQIAALCDRRFGIGGDGLLRVQPATEAGASYFMDYWNADGSLAEMCGNGLRVFVAYLLGAGLARGPVVSVQTRAGLRVTYVEDDQIRADMGRPELLGTSVAVVDGARYAGQAISMGNPHLVCDVAEDLLGKLDLNRQPGYDTALFPTGVNVEFSVALAPDHRRMRVYERGVGETMSCGTGATAVGVAALRAAGASTGSVTVDVPGGRLRVTVDEHTSWLTGPAVLAFTGDIDLRNLRKSPGLA